MQEPRNQRPRRTHDTSPEAPRRAEPGTRGAAPHNGGPAQENTQRNGKTERKLTVIGDAYSSTAWLFMYDVLDIGRVYFRLGYHDGDDVSAYADAHKLRVPLHDLFYNGYLNPKLYDVKSERGGKAASIDIYGGSTRDGVTSTIVTLTDDPGRRLPISIIVSAGPGLLGEDGDIRPKRGADRTRVSISMSRQEARTMAGQALGHYAFWEVRKRQYVKPRAKQGGASPESSAA